ncbi:MAG: RES family NAD+ phosphorylase [Actinomycetota bacterium]|nr:RES family NAD+ phosphorylase [Actinomycetota bacterium]
MATFEPTRLNGVDLVSLDVGGYRNQAPGFDPRSGEGARRFGGRFNPPRSFPVLYLCLTEPCVVAELTRQAERQSVQLEDLLPRELWSVTAELTGVLDLTAMTTLSAVAIDPTDLVRPDHAFTQQLGEAAHERGIQAIKSPSVTGVDEILAIFPENLGAVAVEVELVRLWSSIDDV